MMTEKRITFLAMFSMPDQRFSVQQLSADQLQRQLQPAQPDISAESSSSLLSETSARESLLGVTFSLPDAYTGSWLPQLPSLRQIPEQFQQQIPGAQSIDVQSDVFARYMQLASVVHAKSAT